jgi:hypothetical protein
MPTGGGGAAAEATATPIAQRRMTRSAVAAARWQKRQLCLPSPPWPVRVRSPSGQRMSPSSREVAQEVPPSLTLSCNVAGGAATEESQGSAGGATDG